MSKAEPERPTVNCKGCDGLLTDCLTDEVSGSNIPGGGVIHIPASPCRWFYDTAGFQIMAYINTERYKARRGITA